jgi:hypothetical protein
MSKLRLIVAAALFLVGGCSTVLPKREPPPARRVAVVEFANRTRHKGTAKMFSEALVRQISGTGTTVESFKITQTEVGVEGTDLLKVGCLCRFLRRRAGDTGRTWSWWARCVGTAHIARFRCRSESK